MPFFEREKKSKGKKSTKNKLSQQKRRFVKRILQGRSIEIVTFVTKRDEEETKKKNPRSHAVMFDWGVIKTINTLGWLKTHLLTTAHTVYQHHSEYILIKAVRRTWKIIYYDLVDIDFSLHVVVAAIDPNIYQCYESIWNDTGRNRARRYQRKNIIFPNYYYYYILNAMPHFSGFSSISLGCRCEMLQSLQSMKLDDNNDIRLQTLWKNRNFKELKTFSIRNKSHCIEFIMGQINWNLLFTLCTMNITHSQNLLSFRISYVNAKVECISLFFSSIVGMVFLQTKIRFKHWGKKFCIDKSQHWRKYL